MNLYRLLLRAAPRRLRDKHGAEMEAMFRATLSGARHRGARARLAIWIQATLDILAAAAREPRLRRSQRTRVGSPRERTTMMIGSDIRYALRSLQHQKLATGLVIGMLGLGIGATVAVFSLVNGIFLRPFPFPDPERLVYINETAPKWNLDITSVDYPDFAAWQDGQQAFEALALYDTQSFNVTTSDGADRLDGARVTAGFARVLGIEPIVGRMFTTEEDQPQGPQVAVIGEALWRERFGGRANVLGQSLKLNSRPFTIVGVLPKAAEFPGGVRLWIPIQGDRSSPNRSYEFDGIGRLKPGISLEQANQDLLRAHRPIFDARDKEKVVTPFARDLRTEFTREYDTIASTLGAAVSLLLVVACANVASVMLARALARRREMGIRLAIGASRGRLLRQLLVENIILSIAGGAIGLVIGQWAIQGLVQLIPDQAPGWTNFALDARMVAFTLATSMMTAILFGWAPALQAMNTDLRGLIATTGTGATTGVRGGRTLRALVVAEFALASLMFVCGGLLVRAYDRVQHTDPGFNPSGVLTFTVSIPFATYDDDAKRAAFRARLVERLRALPGVTNAGWITCAPLSGCHRGNFFTADGAAPRGPNDPNPVVLTRFADPGYFAAMGIRLKEGRFFTDLDGIDGRDKESAIIVNETFAKTFWPNGHGAVGKRVRQGPRSPWLTVVGIAADVKHYGLERPMGPGVYLPQPLVRDSGMTVALRTNGDAAALAAPARAALRDIDPELPAFNVRTMEERMRLSMQFRAAYSWMLGVFAALALLLALGGTYGVTSYLVSQRTKELGIRVALGAGRREISRTVLRGSLAVISIGVMVGVAGAVGAGRWLASLLFGVPPYDAIILVTAVVALFATGLLANWLPARRAARVDPMTSLRSD